MTKLNKRKKQKAWRKSQIGKIRSRDMSICLNCGEKGPHFIGPSFGDPGFYICTKKPKDCDDGQA